MLRLALSILWPSFLAAGVGISIIFTLVNPMELLVLGEPVRASRGAVYSLGFFMLWAVAAAASAMSALLLTSRRPGERELGGERDE